VRTEEGTCPLLSRYPPLVPCPSLSCLSSFPIFIASIFRPQSLHPPAPSPPTALLLSLKDAHPCRSQPPSPTFCALPSPPRLEFCHLLARVHPHPTPLASQRYSLTYRRPSLPTVLQQLNSAPLCAQLCRAACTCDTLVWRGRAWARFPPRPPAESRAAFSAPPSFLVSTDPHARTPAQPRSVNDICAEGATALASGLTALTNLQSIDVG
jgi:hypothetical protein